MKHAQTLLTGSMTIIAMIAVFVVLSLTRDVAAPILAALLLGVVLSPLSDFLDRLHVPSPLAAFISVGFAICLLLSLLVLIEPYVTRLIEQAPLIWIELQELVEQVRRLFRGLEQISEDMSEAIEGDSSTESANAGVVPDLTATLFYAPAFAAQLLTFIGTLYFFLLGRTQIYAWVGSSGLALSEADLRFADRRVSRYFLTITAINFCFGSLITIVMAVLGMPSPVLWGTLAFLVNYLLYLGPASLAAALVVAGFVTFDGAFSFAPAALYLSLNAMEGQFITPTLIGKSMSVNPLMVFLSLVFWLWLWGPIGGIIAIPLLVWSLAVFGRSQTNTHDV